MDRPGRLPRLKSMETIERGDIIGGIFGLSIFVFGQYISA